MAKKRKASTRKSARRTAPVRSVSRSSDDKSGMWVAAVIAVVAVVGLVLLYTESNASGNVTYVPPGGYSASEQTGWDLGGQVGKNWDGTEMRKYCSYECGDACADSVTSLGNEQGNCYESCRQNCETQIMRTYGTDPNSAAY